MARVLVPSKVPDTNGVDPAFVAAQASGSGGNSFMCGPNTILEVKTAGSAVVMTVDTPGVVDSGNLPNKTINIPTNSERRYKFGQRLSTYQQADGTVWIDFDVVTGVQLAVIEP